MRVPTKIGIIGCGNICGIYFANSKVFEAIDIVACADLAEDRAAAKAAQSGCRAMIVEQILSDPDIEIVLNPTTPKAHADVACALRSGRAHRASGEMAYHVLDIMHAFHDSSDLGKHIKLESTCAKPQPLPIGLGHGILDE